jgi:hypothetical protein
MLSNCAISTGLPIVLNAQFNKNVKTEADLSMYEIAEGHDIARYAAVMYGIWNRSLNPIDPTNEIAFKLLKGRNEGPGHNSAFPFNGNTGKISNIPIPVETKSTDTGSKRKNVQPGYRGARAIENDDDDEIQGLPKPTQTSLLPSVPKPKRETR